MEPLYIVYYTIASMDGLDTPFTSAISVAPYWAEHTILKFIRQWNRLFLYLIGSWGLRTGFYKKEWWSVYFHLCSFCYTCLCFYLLSVFAWEMFQCPDSLNESKIWVCRDSLCVVLSLSLSLANTQLDMLQGLAWQRKCIISLLWAITNSLSPTYKKSHFLFHLQVILFTGYAFFHQSSQRDFNYAHRGCPHWNLQCLLLAFKFHICWTLLIGRWNAI